MSKTIVQIIGLFSYKHSFFLEMVALGLLNVAISTFN